MSTYEAVDVNDIEMQLNWLEIKANTKPETEFTTTYPLNGKKIKRLIESDVTIFKVNDEYYQIKVVNKDNMFGTGAKTNGNPFNENSKISNNDGLYMRIISAAAKLGYKSFEIIDKSKLLHTTKIVVDLLNNAIDWLEKYTIFHEKDINKLLEADK